MNKIKLIKVFSIIVGGTLTFVGQIVPLPASASADYDQLFSFGDSFSDIGNIFNLTGGTRPLPPYYEGRRSNGPLWTDYLAESLNLDPVRITEYSPPAPQPPDGVNFAISGAESGLDFDPEFGINIGTLSQVDRFTDLVTQGDLMIKDNPLYTLFVGGNDYLNLVFDGNLPDTPEETEAAYSQVVDNITTVLTTLAEDDANKAKNIILLDMPNLNLLPVAQFFEPPEMNSLNNLVMGHNNYLNSELQELSTLFPQTRFTLFSLNNLFNNVTSNPGEFGFTNVTENCLSQAGEVCSEPNDYFFWDLVHLTTSAHEIVADSVMSTPEPSLTLSLITLGFLGTGSTLSRRVKKANTEQSTNIL